MADDTRDLYNQYEPLIEWAIGFVCRQFGFYNEVAEDFGQDTRAHFLDPDAVVLSKYKGRSEPKTYICVVVRCRAKDYCIKRWGRWRPSKVAQDYGPAAVLLEELSIRRRVPFEEALEQVLQRFPDEDPKRLRDVAGRFPPHTLRQFVDDEELLDRIIAAIPNPEEALLEAEKERQEARLKQRLAKAISRLDVNDRLLLKLHYADGLTIAAIARLWRVDQKQLYRQLERILKRLRAMLREEEDDL